MIIFLYGADDYRSREKLKEIVERYREIHKSGLNLEFFEGENLNFQDFKNKVETTSMFEEKRLLVLKEVFTNKNFQEEFLKEGKKIVDSENIIVIYEKELSEKEKKTPFFKFLKENSKSQEFQLLEGQRLRNWAKKEFEKYQVAIEEKALDKLVNFLSPDLWQFSNEIKKLVSFKFSHKLEPAPTKIGPRIIREEDVDSLIESRIEVNIFKTIEAIALRNKKRALELLHSHLEKGDNPLYLFSMINFQFRNLLLIRELIEKKQTYYSILRKIRLNPFVVEKNYQQAQKFSLLELKRIYQKIFQIEYQIKTGKIEPVVALDLFISEI